MFFASPRRVAPGNSVLARSERAERQARSLTRWAMIVFIFGTLTFRARNADALSNAPVDNAAAIRIAADGIAMALVLLAYIHERLSGARGFAAHPRGAATSTWFALYIAAIAVSAFAAISPLMVLFRLADMTVCATVAIAFAMRFSLGECITFIRNVVLALASTVGLSVIAFPSEALIPKPGGLWPYQVSGVIPIVTVNTVGMLGVILLAISLGTGPAKRRWLLLLGLALIVAAQYRTGYVASSGLLGLSLVARRGASSKLGLAVLVPVLAWGAASDRFEQAWVRGEQASASVTTLSGRTEYWAAALEAAERSPIFGLGLSSGTRFEVLDRIGHGATSTIHNTWIEVYVGTGAFGLIAFTLAFFTALAAAWRWRDLSLVPLLFFTAILVRTITGTTIELAGFFGAFFLMLAVALRREASGAWPAVHRT